MAQERTRIKSAIERQLDLVYQNLRTQYLNNAISLIERDNKDILDNVDRIHFGAFQVFLEVGKYVEKYFSECKETLLDKLKREYEKRQNDKDPSFESIDYSLRVEEDLTLEGLFHYYKAVERLARTSSSYSIASFRTDSLSVSIPAVTREQIEEGEKVERFDSGQVKQALEEGDLEVVLAEIPTQRFEKPDFSK